MELFKRYALETIKERIQYVSDISKSKFRQSFIQGIKDLNEFRLAAVTGLIK